MSDTDSLADRAVIALAAVAAIGQNNTTLDHPERHIVRSIKREAEGILREAFTRAEGLAYMARDLSEMTANAIKDAVGKQEA